MQPLSKADILSGARFGGEGLEKTTQPEMTEFKGLNNIPSTLPPRNPSPIEPRSQGFFKTLASPFICIANAFAAACKSPSDMGKRDRLIDELS